MKKDYLEPRAEAVSIHGKMNPLCASADSLSPLQESNDMEGLHWS